MEKCKYNHKNSGSILKIKGQFFYRLRKNGTPSFTLLRDKNGIPCKTRLEAEQAAKPLMRLALSRSMAEAEAVLVQNKFIKSEKLSHSDLVSVVLESEKVADKGKAYYVTVLNRLYNFAQYNDVGELSPEIIDKFFKSLNVSARTYNFYVTSLARIWKLAEIANNPFSKIEKKKEQGIPREALTQEEVQSCFEFFATQQAWEPLFKSEMEVLFYLGVFTGARLKDAVSLTWKMVDLPGKIISYTPEKTKRSSGRKVRVPIHTVLFEKLKACPRESKYVLPHVFDRYSRNVSGITKDIQRIIETATGHDRSHADREDRQRRASAYGFHALRHTFVSMCANNGVPLDIVKDVVGHTSTLMTQHYTHFSDEARAKILSAFSGLDENLTEVKGNLMDALAIIKKLDDKEREIVRMFLSK